MENYKIGDIFFQYGTGWCCYEVYFWKIVKVSKKCVWLQELKYEIDKVIKKEIEGNIYKNEMLKPKNEFENDKICRIIINENCTKDEIKCPYTWRNTSLCRYQGEPVKADLSYKWLY